MDELVHHCVRELAFDGDLGCDSSRLRDFIVGFYNVDATHPQTVDDAFCAFVWSLIAQQPTVRVGTIPPGGATEVFIAPQTSAKRKAAAKGEALLAEEAPVLNVVPNATARSLEDLKAEYGDNVRIAVDPATSFAAITGSHIRPSKLSPMVYSALQLITRGREEGLSIVDLGKKSKYDQKTCFYLVKQLIELDLIVKRKKSGVGTNFAIHKYFYERDRSWQLIEHEETQAEVPPQADSNPVNDEQDDYRVDADVDLRSTISFEPIDTRHLSSLPLVRARILKLLKASQNNMHNSTNMLIAIGFSNPTRLDRRFFQARLRELVATGVVERVSVVNPAKPAHHARCLRLASPDSAPDLGSLKVVVEPETSVDDDMALEDATDGLKMNLSLHRQITDLLEEAGSKGLTLNELSRSAGDFDKRTIELLLYRAERNQPPAHLSDIGIAGLMETFGREHRHRYYTMGAFRAAAAKEGLDDAGTGYAVIDFSAVGGFAPVPADCFYSDEKTVQTFADTYRHRAETKAGSKPKKARVNPILADGSVKLGRPRKYPEGSKQRRKRKRDPDEDAANPEVNEVDGPPKKGRPAKKARVEPESRPAEASAKAKATAPMLDMAAVGICSKSSDSNNQIGGGSSASTEKQISSSSPSNKRARSPPTANPPGDIVSIDEHDTAHVLSTEPPKKRGRPPKTPKSKGVSSDKAALVESEPVPDKEPSKKRAQKPKASKAKAVSADKTAFVEKEPAPAPEEPPRKRGRPSVQIPTTSLLEAPQTYSNDEPAAFNSTARSPRRELESVQSPMATLSTPTEPRRSPRKGKPAVRLDGSLTITPIFAQAVPQDITVPAAGLEAEFGSEPVDRDVEGNTAARGFAAASQPLLSPEPLPYSDPPRRSPTPTHDMQGQEPEVSAKSESHPRKMVPRGKLVNVSHLRRENELYRLLGECGGIMNVMTRDFYDAHATLLEDLARAGEPTSAPPGIRLDKRTARSALDAMESRGRIKIVKTSLFTSTGASRPAMVAYLPNIEQEALDAFLVKLGQSFAIPPTPFMYRQVIKKLDEPMNYSSHGNGTRSALPLQLLKMEARGGDDNERWERNDARADQLFGFDDTTIREVLLAERTTLGQLYGFVVGKGLRARRFHLAALDFFDRKASSSRIISSDARIVEISFFYNDFPLADFCAAIGAITHDELIDAYMKTPEGPATSVANIPSALHTSLQIGRARSRNRILDLLEFLRSLDLVVPLRPSNSSTPAYTCEANGKHPTAFDVASLDGWSTLASANAPMHWRFNEIAPIHVWSQSETSPSFWKEMPVQSVSEAVEYWKNLTQACRDKKLYPNIDTALGVSKRPSASSIGVARSLRRPASWNDGYYLTWHQEQYLQRFIDQISLNSPISDEGEALLQKISWIVSAPREAVEKCIEKAQRKSARNLGKTRRKGKRKVAEGDAQKITEGKASLQRKSAEARLQRETDWDNIIQRIYPHDLTGSTATRMRRVRARFLQSTGNDVEKWEGEIAQAIREIKIKPKGSRSKTKIAPLAPLATTRTIQLPLVVSQSDRSVQTLIAEQGTPRGNKPVVKDTRRGKKKVESREDSQPKPIARRSRFLWNRDYDELARDASAIIRARCRGGTKLDWAALEQVFPLVPRNSVRQRITTLREGPGAGPYLQRLEDRWYAIWMQYRGTDELPDPNPSSPADFDIAKHLEFLRKYIDKNALRVGFAPQITHVKLPVSVEEIDGNWDLSEKLEPSPVWEFMWNDPVDEGREKGLLKNPFTLYAPTPSKSFVDFASEEVSVAESAVKMVFGSHGSSYEPDIAAQLLHGVGEQEVSKATSNLLARGILARSTRDPLQTKPGRTLKISETNLNALNGMVSRDAFQDASALEDMLSNRDIWHPWPLLATDGDISALLQLVSEDRVEFEIDTSHAASHRSDLDWNSKNANDDQLETMLNVRFLDLMDDGQGLQGSECSLDSPPSGPEACIDGAHGLTVDGQPACCKEGSTGIVDCVGCLEGELAAFISGLDPQSKGIVEQIVPVLLQAASKGLKRHELQTLGEPSRVLHLVQRMSELSIPLVHWVGYSACVIVASWHIQPWSVLISESPVTKIFPRRWYDLRGKRMSDIWQSALKIVVALILFRPGITTTELLSHLSLLFDRQEVCEVLDHLVMEGALKRRRSLERSWERAEDVPTSCLDEEAEQHIFWFIGDEKHWYQIGTI